MKSSFFSDRDIKRTRKRHVCYWCGEHIKAGSSAVALAGVWDGDFWRGTMHPECRQALQLCERSSDDGGFYAYDQERGMTQEETEKYRDYRNNCEDWLYERKEAAGRPIMPVALRVAMQPQQS